MDDRVTALIARIEKLERQVEELKKFVKMSDSSAIRQTATGEGAGVMDCLEKLSPGKGRKVKIAELRNACGMDDKAFDNALYGLFTNGHVALHQTGALSLSVRSMSESLMGENGELFTEVSLNQD